MSKVVEFRMGKGRTSKPEGVEEWNRKYLEVTIRLPEQYTEEDFHVALTRAEYEIDQWLEAPEAGIPELDIAEINSLPWISYQTKQACTKPDQAGWIFSAATRHTVQQQPVVGELREAIGKAPKGKLQLGNVLYSFSGPEDNPKLFISRKPVKQK